MPVYVHSFYDPKSCKFAAIEIQCEKSVSLVFTEMSILARSIAVKALDEQITDVIKLFEKNPQLVTKMFSTQKSLGDTITVSKIWI